MENRTTTLRLNVAHWIPQWGNGLIRVLQSMPEAKGFVSHSSIRKIKSASICSILCKIGTALKLWQMATEAFGWTKFGHLCVSVNCQLLVAGSLPVIDCPQQHSWLKYGFYKLIISNLCSALQQPHLYLSATLSRASAHGDDLKTAL